MNRIFLICLLFFTSFSFSQKIEKTGELNDSITYADSIIERIQIYDSFDVPRNFKGKYRIALNRVRKVYPLALRAAELMDSLDEVMDNTDKKRLQKKASRQTQKELTEDFKFIIKDLYISEGQILTKLIHRETGMTVREIIKKYKNGFEASLYGTLGKMFEQDLDAVYLPDTDDFVIECVVQDILAGKVDFDPHIEIISKQDFQTQKKNDKNRRKENKKKTKTLKKELKSGIKENTAQSK